MQSMQRDSDGVVRFKQNAIVRFLLNEGPFTLNQLENMEFSNQDREQFAQLIGYSVSGYRELSYVSDESFKLAEEREVAAEAAIMRHHSQP